MLYPLLFRSVSTFGVKRQHVTMAQSQPTKLSRATLRLSGAQVPKAWLFLLACFLTRKLTHLIHMEPNIDHFYYVANKNQFLPVFSPVTSILFLF